MAKKRRRPSGQERQHAEALRVAASRQRRQRIIAVVAVLLALTFLATTVGAIIAGGAS